MKYFITLFILTLTVVSCQRKSEYENRVDKFRSQTIGFYVNPKESPLDSNELKTFKGIRYFPIDEQYKVEAQLVWLPQTVFMEMEHSGGDTRPYMKVGTLYFEINHQPQQLMVYQTKEMMSNHQLFVPFSDPTNGSETYGGGRYLDVAFNPASSNLSIDFNFAYAPFCAYTHSYSCPIVPAENKLTEPIRAGERKL